MKINLVALQRQCLHIVEENEMSQWNSCVVTLKAEPSIADDIFQGLTDTTSNMQTHPTWSHALIRWWVVPVFWILSGLHTFVVQVNSLRSVDLTRNVTAGEGTGQVNINPDKNTMEHRQDYVATVNMEHRREQHNPAMGSEKTDISQAETPRRQWLVRLSIIQYVSSVSLQQHVNICAVQLLIRLIWKLAQAVFSLLTFQDDSCAVLERYFVLNLGGKDFHGEIILVYGFITSSVKRGDHFIVSVPFYWWQRKKTVAFIHQDAVFTHCCNQSASFSFCLVASDLRLVQCSTFWLEWPASS